MDSDEIVQCYVSYKGEEGVSVPRRSLVAFERVKLSTGQSQTRAIDFKVDGRDLELMSREGDYVLSCGRADPGSQGSGVGEGDELSVIEVSFTI